MRNGRSYLVDAGPGVVRRASAAFRAGTDALEAKVYTSKERPSRLELPVVGEKTFR